MKYDVAIIGCGITGASIAFELSKYNLHAVVIEKENDIAMKTTKANSGIIHAGYDPKPGTVMARLNVEGSGLVHDLAKLLNFHYRQIGSLVIGKTEDDHKVINDLFDRGIANGVKGMRILKTQLEVHQIEPNVNKDIDYALYAPSAAIVAPWEMCLAFAQTAVVNGVELRRETAVQDITKTADGFRIATDKGEIEARFVINCGGTHADDIYRLVLKDQADKSFTIIPCKGEYYLLDKDQGSLVNTVVFQTPTKIGKGVLVAPTVHDNLIVGPNADFEVGSKDDTGTVQKNIDYVRTSALNSVPDIAFSANIRNFSGVRATLKDHDDFIVEESPYVSGFFNFAGIKSPGLSCGPAFGLEAARMLKKAGLKLVKKAKFTYAPLPSYFSEMSEKEKIQAIKADPRFGHVICRCETVTEGEIFEAIHSPIPAKTIDGVKRRTNAGMGRCQGGFCGPQVFDILKEEWHLKYDEVYQDVTGSAICIAETKEGK
jgi:glycerol-3-phosphate dehydrogenase